MTGSQGFPRSRTLSTFNRVSFSRPSNLFPTILEHQILFLREAKNSMRNQPHPRIMPEIMQTST
ncbi:hypothetical protein RHGRI_004623 [Rhododendron griersonianum]|uniref:Uncharacterized protein n=1 Tax=Rhododendron griersonianum TaxID=479676 RepID=A0AAV6L9A9_9ERIC|nr:hypothetical protein RHGRI_004623 [Rhododendron griersonianum]